MRSVALRALVALVAWTSVALAIAGEPVTDGPYVLRQPDGAWVARWAGLPVELQRVVIGKSSITVPAVGTVPSFNVRLRKSGRADPDEVALSADTPIFVVADTHGQFEILVELLQRHRIVDSQLRWSFGKGHLAVLGDVFDRGPNQTEILWLLYKLEVEAATARGGVHFVLGNHEVMAVLGDRRYLHPKYNEVAQALGVPAYAQLWNRESLLGQWLRKKATVLRLGDYLCLHGGVSREAVDRDLALVTINTAVRAVLDRTEPYLGADETLSLGKLTLLDQAAGAEERELARFLVSAQPGPLWYRGYFAEAAQELRIPQATAADIDAALNRYGAKVVLVGHTIVPTIESLYDGKVIAVQVSMRREDGISIAEGLFISDGRFFRARVDGTRVPLTAP